MQVYNEDDGLSLRDMPNLQSAIKDHDIKDISPKRNPEDPSWNIESMNREEISQSKFSDPSPSRRLGKMKGIGLNLKVTYNKNIED